MGLWDDLTGNTASNAANSAAADTFKKQQNAGKDLRKFGDQYANSFANLSQQFQPYQQAGAGALNMLMSGLGLNGGQGTQDFTNAYRNLPGYQSALETGQNALMAQLNASGRLNSGAAQKAAMRYGSDYEDQRSGDYLTRLMGLQGQGLQATGQAVNTTGQGLQGQLGTRTSAYGGDMQAANTIGLGQVAGAQAQQQGATNLMGTAAYLGGAALGGGGGASAFTNLFKPKAASTPSSFNWGGQQYPMFT